MASLLVALLSIAPFTAAIPDGPDSANGSIHRVEKSLAGQRNNCPTLRTGILCEPYNLARSAWA